MWRKTFLLVTGLCICCVAHYDAYAEARITDEDAVQRRTVNVKGTVLDANDNAPLIGVSVLEQGTTHGVVTDVNGAYSIDVNPEAVLVFSYMGYVTQSIPVGASSQINVRLETDTQMIDDIVVEIGYGGSQRKQDLSMSITTVKVDDVAKGRTQDLATVLQGQVPGMTVQMTGDPMKEANMNIRGRGSKGKDDDETSGSGVLIVVDGVPNAPYMVEDIETVTVLKDAASAAIYGSQAGQGGVILITTRRAQAGQARVSLNISNGIKKVSNLPEMLTSEQYNTVWRKAIESASANLSDYNFADPSSSVYNWTNVTRTNWLDEIFRLGHTQHYGITVSGGSEKLTAIVSAAYDQEDGVLINTYSKALNARMNIEYRITDWLKFSQRANFQTRNGQGDVSTGHQGPIMSALWMPRSATVYETDVNGKLVYDLNGNKKYGGLYPATLNIPQYPKNVMNPVAELTEMRRRYPSTKLYSTSVIEVKPISTLTINSSFTGYMYHHDKDESLPIRKETGSYERKEISREQEFNKDKGWLW